MLLAWSKIKIHPVHGESTAGAVFEHTRPVSIRSAVNRHEHANGVPAFRPDPAIDSDRGNRSARIQLAQAQIAFGAWLQGDSIIAQPVAAVADIRKYRPLHKGGPGRQIVAGIHGQGSHEVVVARLPLKPQLRQAASDAAQIDEECPCWL
jgi:hypothetical protein